MPMTHISEQMVTSGCARYGSTLFVKHLILHDLAQLRGRWMASKVLYFHANQVPTIDDNSEVSMKVCESTTVLL